jgi:hypothetical protein
VNSLLLLHKSKAEDAMSFGGEDHDPWLGALHNFPTVLHSRASFDHEINTENLQRAVLQALRSMSMLNVPMELSISDHDGYYHGSVSFKLGVGNAEAFDVFDRKEQERLLQRIENKGAFPTLDLSFNARYAVTDEKRHSAREDRFLARLLFRADRMEVYVHHLRGMRRIEPEEIITTLIQQIDLQLQKLGYPRLRKENVSASRQNVAGH